MRKLTEILSVLDTTATNCRNALYSGLTDFEDGILVETAKSNGIDCIITRNTKDFKKSPVRALTPAEFLDSREV